MDLRPLASDAVLLQTEGWILGCPAPAPPSGPRAPETAEPARRQQRFLELFADLHARQTRVTYKGLGEIAHHCGLCGATEIKTPSRNRFIDELPLDQQYLICRQDGTYHPKPVKLWGHVAPSWYHSFRILTDGALKQRLSTETTQAASPGAAGMAVEPYGEEWEGAKNPEATELLRYSTARSTVLIQAVATADLPLPVHDFELRGTSGRCGPESDLAWPAEKIAVLAERQQEDRPLSRPLAGLCSCIPSLSTNWLKN